MIDLQNIISFEVSKTIPVNLFRWPKYLWIDENSLVIKPYVLKSKYCDGWNGTYPAVTRKEIVKRLAKFISITQDVSGKTAINSLLKHSGCSAVRPEFWSSIWLQAAAILNVSTDC